MTLAKWVADRIANNREVSSIEVLSESLLRVKRRLASDVLVGTISVPTLTRGYLETFLAANPGLSLVINVPKESTFADDAKECARKARIALGHFGDIHHALRLANPSMYVDPSTTFAEVSLSTHSRVVSTARLDDGRWIINRRGLQQVTVVYLYQYDLSADSVHAVIAAHGPFEAIVKTNPNGNISALARVAAANANRRILKWGEFLKELHKPWT